MNLPGNLIVLSIKKGGVNIGTIGDGTFAVTSRTTPGWSNNSAAQIQSATAPYVATPHNWYVMNRWWAVTPNPQPSAPVQAKTYYHNDDLLRLQREFGMAILVGGVKRGGPQLGAHRVVSGRQCLASDRGTRQCGRAKPEVMQGLPHFVGDRDGAVRGCAGNMPATVARRLLLLLRRLPPPRKNP